MVEPTETSIRHRVANTGTRPVGRIPAFIKIWFVIDAVVALAPPLYWAANGQTTKLFGIPEALLYFLAVNICIATSIIVAYLNEASTGEIVR